MQGEDALVIFQVVEVQTLDSIAESYDTAREVLVVLNSLEADPNTGDMLVVVVGLKSTEEYSMLRAFYEESAMTLTDLAEACACSLEELSRWNAFGGLD